MSSGNGGRIAPETVEVTNIHDNVAQEVVRITVDRLQLVLSRYISHLEARRQWVAPLGILVAILMAFATTSFKDFYLSADTWRAFFIWAMILVFVWLLRCCYLAYKSKKIEDIIEELKSNEPEGPKTSK